MRICQLQSWACDSFLLTLRHKRQCDNVTKNYRVRQCVSHLTVTDCRNNCRVCPALVICNFASFAECDRDHCVILTGTTVEDDSLECCGQSQAAHLLLQELVHTRTVVTKGVHHHRALWTMKEIQIQ